MVIVKESGKLEKDETGESKVFHNGKTTAEGRAPGEGFLGQRHKRYAPALAAILLLPRAHRLNQ
jgi:hypothetical protein